MTEKTRRDSSVTFVLCIENNAICAQALLLCESIRQFGGRQRDARIVAVSPRPGLGVGQATQRQLDSLGVEYIERPLNLVCPEYGTANRVFAAAWVEQRATSEWIVVLDSDTLLLGELELPTHADAAVRPVDMKGSATSGPSDPFDDYWHQLAALRGASLDCLPYLETLIDRQRIRASYNGGLVVVRRSLGLLRAWADLFARSVHAGLKPWRDGKLNVHASTGFVGSAASQYWGSNQAALALALWTTTRRIHLYPENYNIPLHFFPLPRSDRPPVLVHYHWLFTPPHFAGTLRSLRQIGVTPEFLDWLDARLPIDVPLSLFPAA